MDEKKMDEMETQIGDKPVDTGENLVDETVVPVENTEETLEFAQDVVETSEESGDNNVNTGEQCGEETTENPEIVEEPVGSVGKTEEAVEKAPQKGSNPIMQILVGFLLFAGFLGYCWYATGGGLTRVPDVGVAYAKENNLFVYDLKNEPYLVGESMSLGGEYQYFSSAWGAGFSRTGDEIYYLAEISEEGIGKLFSRDLKNGVESVLIGENVFDYAPSKDGKSAAYLSFQDGSVALSVYKDGASREISRGILLQQGTYELSGDGSSVVYITGDGENNSFYVSGTAEGSEPLLLSDSVAMYSVTDHQEKIYYVNIQEEKYSLYSYELGGAPTLVAENITYMTELANGSDILYCQMSDGVIPYTDFITDDITDLTALEEEKQSAVEEMRVAMAAGEGVEPLLQSVFIVTSSGIVDTGKQAISVAPLGGDGGSYVGYGVKTPEPILLSEVDSLDEALYSYYEGMAYGEKEIFVGNTRREIFSLQSVDADPTSVQLAADGKTVAYFVPDAATGTNILMTEVLGDTAAPITAGTNMESMGFLGTSKNLGYFYNYEQGVGNIGLIAQGAPAEMDANSASVIYAEDRNCIYYIADPNAQTGGGNLMKLEKGVSTLLDENVFSFQYKGNGKLAYFKNYNLQEALGDLYYFNGKETKQLDTGVSSIFIN